MTHDEVEVKLARTPFVPLVMHMVDGRKYDVPFSHVIVPRGRQSFILFKGIKSEQSRDATGYEHLQFDQVARLDERRPPAKRRRKAS